LIHFQRPCGSPPSLSTQKEWGLPAQAVIQHFNKSEMVGTCLHCRYGGQAQAGMSSDSIEFSLTYPYTFL